MTFISLRPTLDDWFMCLHLLCTVTLLSQCAINVYHGCFQLLLYVFPVYPRTFDAQKYFMNYFTLCYFCNYLYGLILPLYHYSSASVNRFCESVTFMQDLMTSVESDRDCCHNFVGMCGQIPISLFYLYCHIRYVQTCISWNAAVTTGLQESLAQYCHLMFPLQIISEEGYVYVCQS